jgi:agmatinase
LPPRPPFLAAKQRRPSPAADAILCGLATDGGVSFRPGAVEGPAGIRLFSDSIETYSPRACRDLAVLDVIDVGDVDDRTEVPRAVGTLLDEVWTEQRRPLVAFLGGDHSVTPPAVRAVAERSERLAVIGFDAHLDLREDYPGDHACTYRRIAETGVPCHVFGPRSGAKEEWDDAPAVLASLSTSLDTKAVRRTLARRPVYVTIDIDVLDPSQAPGTGNPEPGGPGFGELLTAVESLSGLNVVAFDVVETSPPLDPSGVTQAAAAVLVREMILRFAKSRT